jgi:hypothetical protein
VDRKTKRRLVAAQRSAQSLGFIDATRDVSSESGIRLRPPPGARSAGRTFRERGPGNLEAGAGQPGVLRVGPTKITCDQQRVAKAEPLPPGTVDATNAVVHGGFIVRPPLIPRATKQAGRHGVRPARQTRPDRRFSILSSMTRTSRTRSPASGSHTLGLTRATWDSAFMPIHAIPCGVACRHV